MPELVRLSLSLEHPLFERLEALVRRSGYENRSEFVRDLVRRELVRTEWESNRVVLGSITLVYNHHRPRITQRLTELQHDHHASVLVTTHVHLSHSLCAEVILVRGQAGLVRKLADSLHQIKGVLHAELSMASTGADLREVRGPARPLCPSPCGQR